MIGGTDPTSALAARIRDKPYLLFPDSFAQYASGGQWTAYRWLQALSQKITPLLIKGGARILVSAPPQHGKSEFISHWIPSWYLNLFPHKRVILGTYSQAYANKWGAKVRQELAYNRRCAIPMRRDTMSKQRFGTKAGGQMMVAGVDGPATGEGADLFVVDDPYKNHDEAFSPRQREHVENWYRAVATTRLQSAGSVIVLHTRWIDDDLIGTLAKEQGWVYLNFKAIWEADEKESITDPMARGLGEALCPERYTVDDLTRIRREVTDLFWHPLYQGASVDVKGSIVKLEDIQYYDELPAVMDEVAIFADLTYEKDEENDYAVFEAWGSKGANVFLMAQIRAQMGLPEQMEAFGRMLELYPRAMHREIEKKANGAAVIAMCEGKIAGLVANNPQTSKGARLAAVSPMYKSHNVWYPNPKLPGNEWVKNNVYEITRMTLAGAKSKNDDTVDTATMACSHFGSTTNAIAALAALIKR